MLLNQYKIAIKNIYCRIFGKYSFIAADITNHCNLRCPFCVNDFKSADQRPIKMREDTFRQLIKLIPLARSGHFFLSCSFEPTLHPDMAEYFSIIPNSYRKRVFFTTNLCKKLSEKEIKAIANSGFRHINISLDTFNPALFEQLRKGSRFDIFISNLERLCLACKKSKSPPKIRYITIALRPNLADLKKIVERCQKEFLASENEIRYCFNVPHLSAQWKAESLPTAADWQKIQQEMSNLSHRITIIPPPPNYYKLNHLESGKSSFNPVYFPLDLNKEEIALRCDADGILRLIGREKAISINLNILRNPKKALKALIRSL